MEYEMRNIDNDPELKPSEARRLVELADPIVGRQGQDGLAIAVDRLDQVLPLKAELDKRLAVAPAERKPFDKVVTIYNLLPTEQTEKLALVRDALSTIDRAVRKGFISAEERKKVADFVREDKLAPIGIADLPEQVASAFTEKDGTRGRLVYIVPKTGRSIWDGHYLIEWADSFRHTTLPDGSVIPGSGRSVIFADMILAVQEDAPKALLLSLCATVAIILLAFRGRLGGLGVVGMVLIGLSWTIAALAIWNTTWPWSEGGKLAVAGMKLNFLNFVALPITIGIGADYSVNVMQRYRIAGGRNIRKVVVQTGGAVILCALTTMFGYLALTLSVNRAIRSFGIAAAAGEICCLLLGVLVLPAGLVWIAERRERRRTAVKLSGSAESAKSA
jgi:predicted RND superfamily exporter protein